MWGALNKLAEQAKSVAAELEGQLDASVGIENQPTASSSGSGGGFNLLGGSTSAAAMDDTFLADNTATSGLDNNDAWNDDDFQVDDDIVFTSQSTTLISPSETLAPAAAVPLPPVVAPTAEASSTPLAAAESSRRDGEGGGGGDGDDSGWDDENLQFDEVNLHGASPRDIPEESAATIAAESATTTIAAESVMAESRASPLPALPIAHVSSPSVSPKAQAAAAMAAVADAFPAVSGFFSSKIKAKLETSSFVETPVATEAALVHDEIPFVQPVSNNNDSDTAKEEVEEEDREVTDGWAGEDENDDLDMSEVDNNNSNNTANETSPLVVADTAADQVNSTLVADTLAAAPDIMTAEISPPCLQQAAPESPSKTEESVAAALLSLLEPVVEDETGSSPPTESDPVVLANEPLLPPTPSPGAAVVTDSSADLGIDSSTTVAAPVVVTADQLASQQEMTRFMESRLDELQRQLQQREQQLMSKTEQMSQMQQMFDAERQEMQNRLEGTKEEAKRRIQMAKDRVESMEAKLQAATKQARYHSSSLSEDAAKQQEMIDALRQEGEKLAVKQLSMEKAVRAAKSEARELREELELEQQAKSVALEKIEQLEADLKATKEKLTIARQSASQADKLETTLQQAREDGERKASTILSLEQQVKELKAEAKDLLVELESSRKGMAFETEREQKKLRKEHNSVIDDLETKLRTTEKEAAVREDALRHEVSELRKRWQDAVRRADSLSMDVQSSTAPLLRQLESMERQSRARAAGWAELETKLRAELEETVISNEKLSKERMEFKTKFQRLERSCKERDDDLRTTKTALEDTTAKVEKLEAQVSDLETLGAKQKAEWAEVERLANEGVSRVRSEMTQTVVDAENRHRSQLDALEIELRQERDKKRQLEQQVQDLLDNNASMIMPMSEGNLAPQVSLGTREKKLRNSENQMSILAGALNGLGGNEAMDDDDTDDGDDADNGETPVMNGGGGGSFAALAELSSKLKVAKGELQTLRKTLADSERTRETLLVELGESRNAKEKLPLFETRVEELTRENREMRLEIQGLQDDIAEVRELYRTQLNVLLEEKAAAASSSNGEDNVND